MLIGAHVSTAGGLTKAVERGSAMECSAIQIFNQSPRMWRPTKYSQDDFEEFREAMAESEIGSVIIHAVYLINCATPDQELRQKSLESLIHALTIGDAIGADGVVLHPGALKGGEMEPGIARSGGTIAEAIEATETCPVLIEQMAGHKGILGSDLDQIEALVEAAGGGDRLGLCLDSCHLFAAGLDFSTPEALASLLDEIDSRLGLERLRALHVNDSKEPFGSRKDRHENLGEGEIGDEALGVFLSDPRFEGLPATLETPGPEKKGPVAADVAKALELRQAGQSRR